MKTKHFFFVLFSCLIITGCSKEEIVNEETDLRALNEQTLLPIIIDDSGDDDDLILYEPGDDKNDNTNNEGSDTGDDTNTTDCVYNDYVVVYYRPSPRFYMSNLRYAEIKRQSAINNSKFNPVDNVTNCKLYNIPQTPNFEYSSIRNQYFEIWPRLGDSDKPGEEHHSIEL